MELLNPTKYISTNELNKTLLEISNYIESIKQTKNSGLYKEKESFVNLPFDETNLKTCMELKKKMVTSKLQYLVLIGIGGSDLGSKAVYDSMFGYYDKLEPERFPKIIFLESPRAKKLEKLLTLLKDVKDPQEILINAISKSGRTLETVSNLEVILEKLPYLKERIVITTTENSPLYTKSKELNFSVLTMPHEISGRFSVFSAVGIFPLLAVGINVIELLEGAMKATTDCLKVTAENPAILSALFLDKIQKEKINIHSLFVFEPELESVGFWYEQLISESLGKNHKGITPITSVGSRDFHSEMQLDLDGPRDKAFTFLWVKNRDTNIKLKKVLELNVREEIKGKDTESIGNAILEAAKHSYEKSGLKTFSLCLSSLSLYELGYFMQYKMLEVAFLGHLMNIDTFLQPAVEDYKKETVAILTKK